MRYLKLIGSLLLAGFLAGCETAQMDRYLTPELGDALGTAIGGVIGAKIGGTTYNGPIAIPLPSHGGSSSPSSAGYGGAGAGSAPAGVPNTPECRQFWDMVYGSCSSSRAMYGTCNVPLLQQKAAACNASGSRQIAGCPAGYFNNGRTCAPLPAGATQCAVGGYCPQGTQCRPNGGCEATRSAMEDIEDFRKKLEKDNADSAKKQEVLQRVDKELEAHRASGGTASTRPQSSTPAGDSAASSHNAPSAAGASGTVASRAPAEAQHEPFTGEMTHPVYKNAPAINDGQGTPSLSRGSAPASSRKPTSFVQDWLDGKPVDPVKLSPEQRRKYYEQKAKAEAAARARTSRKTQAADRAYRETFGGAGPNGTAGTEPDASGTSSGPSAGKPAEDSEDSPSLLEKTSNTWLRPDEDFTPPIEAQGSEPKTYK